MDDTGNDPTTPVPVIDMIPTMHAHKITSEQNERRIQWFFRQNKRDRLFGGFTPDSAEPE